jgi:hypothetical protein
MQELCKLTKQLVNSKGLNTLLFLLIFISLSTISLASVTYETKTGWDVIDTQDEWFAYTFDEKKHGTQMCAFHETATKAKDITELIKLSTSSQTTKDIKPDKHDFENKEIFKDAKESYDKKKKALTKEKDNLKAQKYKKKDTGLSQDYIGICVTPEESDKLIKLFNNSITWEWQDEVWKRTENTLFKKEGIEIKALDSNGNTIEGDISWVEVEGTYQFHAELNNTSYPLSEFGYRVYNDYDFYFEDGRLIESYNIIETEFTKTIPEHRVIDFNSFIEKEANNLTSAKVEAVHYRDTFSGWQYCSYTFPNFAEGWKCLGEIEYYDISFKGEIWDTDPELYYEYDDSTSLGWDNNTESSHLGKRLGTTILNMPFDKEDGNHVLDNSIYNNHGTNNGSVYNTSCGVTSAGNDLGGCYDLESTELDYIDLGDNSDLDIQAESFTISTWVQLESKPAGEHMGIVTKTYLSGGTWTSNYHLLWNYDTDVFVMGWFNDPDWSGVSATTTPTIGEWYFITTTYNYPTENLSIYVNGKLEGTTTNTIAMVANNYPFRIGTNSADSPTGDWAFDGQIDQVQIWDRALSSNEVLNLYNGSINNTNYYGKYAQSGDFKSLVFYNESSTYWNITQSIADSDYVDTLEYVNTTGLVSYFRFDGDVTDSVGLNDGTNSGSSDTVGIVKHARSFDGVDDYVNISDDQSLRFSTKDYSFCIWVKTDQDAAADIFSKRFGIAAAGTGITFTKRGGDTFAVEISDGSTEGLAVGTVDIHDDVWHHLCSVINRGSNELKVYTDASDEQISDISGIGSISNLEDLLVGKNGDGTRLYNGSIDEVLIFNRSLSSTEISEIYDNQKKYYGVNISDPNLVSYWPLDESFDDLVGGNDGTPSGGVTNATGISSGAMNFDGVDDYVQVSDSSSLDLTGDITFSFWMNSRDLTSNALRMFHKNSAYTITSAVDLSGGDNTIRLFNYQDNTYCYSDNIYTENEWQYVTIVQSGGICYFYKNGVDIGTGDSTINPTFPNSAVDLYIGIDEDESTAPYNGQLDEIIIYNRRLSSTEITDLYKAGLSQHADTNVTLQTRTADSYNVSSQYLHGLWGFNNNAYDELGQYIGTWTGTENYSEECGIVGMGACFAGDGSIIDTVANRDKDDDLSLSIWVKPTAFSGDNSMITSGTSLLLDFDNSNSIRFRRVGADRINYAIDSDNYLNKWTHITVTSNSTTTDLWVDSILVDTGAGDSPGSSSASIDFGAISGGTAPLTGYLDEARFYNRTITPSEIQDLYELGSHHIEWNEWKDRGKVNDGEEQLMAGWGDKGKFIQSKFTTTTDDTDVSAYLLNYSITQSPNYPPNITSIILNATSSLNLTTDNLTAYITVDESDDDNYINLYKWYKNGTLNASRVIEDGLIAYYPLDNDTLDYYDSNDGTNNGATYNSTGGKILGAYEFDGVNDYIDLNTPVFPTDGSSWTASVWAKLDGDSNDGTLIAQYGVVGNEDGRMSIKARTSTGKWSLFFGHTSGHTFLDLSDYVIGEWVNIIYTYNGSSVNGYMDGSLINSSGSALSGNIYNGETWIGNDQYSLGGREFNGTIDEVQFYNRSLSTEEIKKLYEGTKTGHLTLNSSETTVGDNWTIQSKACDYLECGDTVISNDLLVLEEVIDNVAPNNPTVLLVSQDSSNTTQSNLNCSTTITDDDGDTLNATITWFENGIQNKTEEFTNQPNGTYISSIIDSDNLIVEDEWICQVNVSDGQLESDKINSTTLEILPTWTSLLAHKIEINDFGFSSDAYVDIYIGNFSTTKPVSITTLIDSFNLEKLTGSGDNDIWMKLQLNGDIVFDRRVRTVSKITGQLEEGIANNLPFVYNVTSGTHSIIVSIKKATGTGTIEINDIDMSLIKLESSLGNSIYPLLYERNYTVSSTTFEAIDNISFNLNPTPIAHELFFLSGLSVTSTGDSTLSCYIKDNALGIDTPYLVRNVNTNVGAIELSAINPVRQLEYNTSFFCLSTTGETVTLETSSLNIPLRDSKGNPINFNFGVNPNTNWSINRSLPSGTNSIVNTSIVIRNGTGALVTMSSSIYSATQQTPVFYIESNDSCSSKKEKFFTSDTTGSAFINPLCDALELGSSYSFNFKVNTTDELILYDESINLIETTDFDINTSNTNPIVIFHSPTNGSALSGNVLINWSVFDLQEQSTLTNITLNGYQLFNNSPESISNFTFDTNTVADGLYNLTAISCDNGTLCGNTTIIITISQAPIVDNVFPAQGVTYNYLPNEITYNLTATDGTDKCWYNINSGTNSSTVPAYTNFTGVAGFIEGANNVTVYCNDSLNNIGSDVNLFTVDTTAPTITIIEPVGTYNQTTINLNTSSNENINTWLYELNGGSNTTFSPNTTISAIEGINSIRVCGNDSVGNMGCEDGVFSVNTQPGDTLLVLPEETVFNSTEEINITSICKWTNGTMCPSTIYCRLTSYYPNETLYLSEELMTYEYNGLYSYHINHTNRTNTSLNVKGDYSSVVSCYDGYSQEAPFTWVVRDMIIDAAQTALCRYRKYGFYNIELPFMKEANCI